MNLASSTVPMFRVLSRRKNRRSTSRSCSRARTSRATRCTKVIKRSFVRRRWTARSRRESWSRRSRVTSRRWVRGSSVTLTMTSRSRRVSLVSAREKTRTRESRDVASSKKWRKDTRHRCSISRRVLRRSTVGRPKVSGPASRRVPSSPEHDDVTGKWSLLLLIN